MIFLLIRLTLIRSHRLTVRTDGFQSSNQGSNPRGTAIKSFNILLDKILIKMKNEIPRIYAC